MQVKFDSWSVNSARHFVWAASREVRAAEYLYLYSFPSINLNKDHNILEAYYSEYLPVKTLGFNIILTLHTEVVFTKTFKCLSDAKFGSFSAV